MQQDDSATSYLGQPRAEVASYSIVGMKAINVQKVDGFVIKLGQCVVEASSEKIGKLPIVAIIVVVDLVENFLAVKAGVLIAVPVIDGVTQAGEFEFFDGLAKCEVGLAPVSAEFDDKAGLQGGDQIICKCEMAGPAADISGLIAAWEEPGRR